MSEEGRALRSAWASATSTPVHSAVYRLPHDATGSIAGLSTTYEKISVFFTFRFAETLDSDAGTQWETSFHNYFARAILNSPGGVVASGGSFGWELGRQSLCAIFSYLSVDAMESFLGEGEGRRLLEELLGWRASAGVEVEYMTTVQKFKHGWLGSIDKTRPTRHGRTIRRWTPCFGISSA